MSDSKQDTELLLESSDIPTELGSFSDSTNCSSWASVWLIVRGQVNSRIYPLHPQSHVTFGRGREADVVINDTRVSRLHARIVRDGSTITVEDLGSRNGTLVNRSVLHKGKCKLGAGDIVRLAGCEAAIAFSTTNIEPENPAHFEESHRDNNQGVSSELIVADPTMKRVFQMVQRLATVDTNVLILGETGVGKEVIARELHRRSARAQGPFVSVNCPALPSALLESELFGYEKGAFTGADRNRKGLIEAARNGTLLLDEIGDLPLNMQVKLLSVIENRSVLRLGTSKQTPIDVRFLCATHRDLRQDVRAGRFREDLFYRISGFTIELPPLRERPAEILLLASLFIARIAKRNNRPPPELSTEASKCLMRWPWPGNIRELRNAMDHAMVLIEHGMILPSHLPIAMQMLSDDGVDSPLRNAANSAECEAIERALEAENGNQTKAALRLGIARRTLIYKMRKYGLR